MPIIVTYGIIWSAAAVVVDLTLIVVIVIVETIVEYKAGLFGLAYGDVVVLLCGSIQSSTSTVQACDLIPLTIVGYHCIVIPCIISWPVFSIGSQSLLCW